MLEFLLKDISDLERAINEKADKVRDEIKATINGRIKDLDARIAAVDSKYAPVRAIVFAVCVMILTAFMGAVIAQFGGIQLKPPTLPQPLSIPPRTP